MAASPSPSRSNAVAISPDVDSSGSRESRANVARADATRPARADAELACPGNGVSMSGRLGSVRLDLRTLARNREFATNAVLSLSVAIALNATISALIDGMVDRPRRAIRPRRRDRLKRVDDNYRVG